MNYHTSLESQGPNMFSSHKTMKPEVSKKLRRVERDHSLEDSKGNCFIQAITGIFGNVSNTDTKFAVVTSDTKSVENVW